MKKFIILCFVFVLSLGLVGCKKDGNDPVEPDVEIDYVKVNDLIDSIDYLYSKKDELNYKKEEIVNEIERIKKVYSELNEEEIKLVENYNLFEQILTDYENFKKAEEEKEKELAKKKKAIKEALEVAKDALPRTCGQRNLELPTEYTSEEGVKVFIGWFTDDPQTISVDGVVIQHRGTESKKVKMTAYCRCEGIVEKFERNVTVVALPYKPLPKKPVFAYYMQQSKPLSDIEAETIDVLNLSFAGITANGEVSIGSLNTSVLMQERKKGIRVMFSLQEQAGFQKWTSTAANRAKFATNIVEAVEKYHFDGVDIDWEYPDGNEVPNYVEFLKELKTKLKRANKEYLLTTAVYGGNGAHHYNIKEAAQYLDYIHLMTYDLNDANLTSHLTSLGGSRYGIYTGKGTVDAYITSGAPMDKLVLGGAFYGKVYEISKSATKFLGERPINKPYTISYSNIKHNYLDKIGQDGNIHVEKKWDKAANAAYLEVTEYDDNKNVVSKKFITYDDPESLKLKANFVFDNGMAGMMFWELGEEDRVSNDLVHAIHSVFAKH